MVDTRTPYQRYADYCRTVAGIEPKPEEDWERDSNRAMIKLPSGASYGQIAGVVMQTKALRMKASKQRKAERDVKTLADAQAVR